MTHVSRDVIQHLKSFAEKVTMINSHSDRDNYSNKDSHSNKDSQSDKKNVLKINECETCALFKAHRIIFRLSDIAETFDKSFYRITYDLMQLFSVLSKDE
jgi:succinate dehydrogenase/fumarate reductase-like Fe-S protein